MVSLLCFSSPFSLHNGLSLSSHLSFTVGYSAVGHGSGVEVRVGKLRSAWYGGDFWVFWVHFLGIFGSKLVWLVVCLSFFQRGLQRGFLSISVGKPSCTSHGSARLSATSMRSASMNSSWSEWSFGFYWSQVVKFRSFCLWVLLIDAFLVDLWSFGCLS